MARQGLPADRLLWINYEEMKANLPRCVRLIAAFCDIPCSDVVVESVVRGSDFAAMKEQFMMVDTEREAQGKRIKKNHIRKGQSGGWRDVLSLEQSSSIDAVHDRRCVEEKLPAQAFYFGS